VPFALKKAQEPFADLVPAPKFLAYRFTRHTRLSFAGFNLQIIADAANPRNERRVAKSLSQECHPAKKPVAALRTDAVTDVFSAFRDFKIEFRVAKGQPCSLRFPE
jgi:hypothetical protein